MVFLTRYWDLFKEPIWSVAVIKGPNALCYYAAYLVTQCKVQFTEVHTRVCVRLIYVYIKQQWTGLWEATAFIVALVRWRGCYASFSDSAVKRNFQRSRVVPGTSLTGRILVIFSRVT